MTIILIGLNKLFGLLLFNFLKKGMSYFLESERYLRELTKRPNTLTPENYRDGYISVSQFYNFFHGGFCGPYIRNPNYMLIVDFRYIKVIGKCYHE